MWRFDPPTHLGLGRGEEAGQREQAAAALVERGGGAGAKEGKLAVAVVAVGWMSDAGGVAL